jgi:hypothetical protein
MLVHLFMVGVLSDNICEDGVVAKEQGMLIVKYFLNVKA